jgi:hypothetical protein
VLGVLLVVSVYYFPSGVVGRLRSGTPAGDGLAGAAVGPRHLPTLQDQSVNG